MAPPVFSDISKVKSICEENQLDRKESLKIISSFIALTQLISVGAQMGQKDPLIYEKSLQTFDFFNRQIQDISSRFPAKDQQTLAQIQKRLKEYLFSPPPLQSSQGDARHPG